MALSHSNPSLILSSILIFSSSLFFLSHATDTLSQDQSLRDGQTLVSAGGIFEFGFFSPGKSKNRYVGIWHHNTSTTSYVWVANRENPVMDSSGSITVNGTGNLVLTDGKGNVVWSTNTSSTEATSNYTMQLLDLGNLVLEAGDGTVTWKSFDHPTDTFLPGMQIKLDVKNNISTTLFTSWKSPDDPSPGNYTLGLDPTGSAQIFIWESGSKKWWRSGQFNGQNFVGIIYRPLYLYGFKLTNDVNQGVMFYTYSPYNDTTQRFVLQPDGVENCSVLNKDTRDWTTVWKQPVNDCEKYNYCGMNAKCSSDTATPKCSCLQGFEPKSIGNWSAGNWSGGCVRRTQLGCQNNLTGDGFAILKGVKLADSSTWNSVVGDKQGCEKNCLSNCSCSAYTYNSNTGCLQWEHDLIDIYQFADGQYDMFIKLPASELGSKSKVWITIVVVPSVVVFFLATCCFLWWKYRKQIKDFLQKGGKQELTFSGNRSQIESKVDFSGPSQYGEEGDEGSELPLFTLDSIATATDNFSDSNKLGQGGFGYVYKGMLLGGDEIAVKRLSRSSGQGIDEFKNEVILIAKLQHRNLVRLIGCCIQGEEKILIYEYLPNKSLDAFLFDPTKQALLDWSTRFNIIEGISRGLLYLHRDSRLRIVHRDLKASNILLDEEMNPKISDFGMAKIFGGNQNQGNTNRVVGTYGYMSPEYAMEGLFSVKSDVYSFGILILEIITGKRNSSFHRIEECPSIIGYAYQLWKEDKAEELIDPSIRTSCPIQQAVRCVHIALLCVQDRANERPDIPYVILMLGSLSSVLPTPKPPTFKFHGSSDGTDKVESFSTYDVTITMLHGR